VLVLLVVLLCVNLFMLFEILRSLERFLANLADVGLERGVYSEMASDVVSLSTAGATVLPFAGETEIVGALASNMVVAKVVVEGLGVAKRLRAVLPETPVGGLWSRLLRGGGLLRRRRCLGERLIVRRLRFVVGWVIDR
jgi:hypothetical protein